MSQLKLGTAADGKAVVGPLDGALSLSIVGSPGAVRSFELAEVSDGVEADEISGQAPGVLGTGTTAVLNVDAYSAFRLKLIIDGTEHDELVYVAEDPLGLARIPDEADRDNCDFDGLDGKGYVDLFNRNLSKIRRAFHAGATFGFTPQASRPTPAGIGTNPRLWANNDSPSKLYFFDGTQDVQLGTAGAHIFTVDDAQSSSSTDIVTLVHTTSGAAAAGMGAGLLFRLEDDGGTVEDAARLRVDWRNAGASAEQSRVTLQARTAGGALADILHVWGTGRAGIGTGATEPAGLLDLQGVGTVSELALSRVGAAGENVLLRLRQGTTTPTNQAFIGLDPTNRLVLGQTANVVYVANSGVTIGPLTTMTAGFAANSASTVTVTDGSGGAVTNVLNLAHNAGSPVAGIGTSFNFLTRQSSGFVVQGADIAHVYADVTNNLERSYLRLRAREAGAMVDVFYLWSTGKVGIGTGTTEPTHNLQVVGSLKADGEVVLGAGGTNLAFFGGTPAGQRSAYDQSAYSTASRALLAPAGQDNTQIGSVYAKFSDLERAFQLINSLIDDAQAFSLAAA